MRSEVAIILGDRLATFNTDKNTTNVIDSELRLNDIGGNCFV